MHWLGSSKRNVSLPHQNGRGNPPWLPALATKMSWIGNQAPVRNVISLHPRKRFFASLRMTRCGYGISLAMAWVVAFSFVLPVTVFASGTPVAFDADPGRCTGEPRTLDNLEHILASATPSVPIERPATGRVIDPSSETGQRAFATIETLVACLNAGDRLRAYALYTDDYLATILQPGDLPAVATPQPNVPDELTRIVTIDLHELPNQGVLATVTLDPALIPVQKIFEFILVPVDGQWKIDSVINEIDFSLP